MRVVEVGSVGRPVRLVVRDDDLARTRLTVFFRLLLAIPLLVWLALRGIAAFVAAFVLWLAVLIEKKGPTSIHDFVASYVRYATQVGAYILLAANPYPWFRVHDDYPVDVEVAPPVTQSRWTGFFRLFLAIPAFLVAATLGGGFSLQPPAGSWRWSGGESYAAFSTVSVAGVSAAAALLTWFVVLARGVAPRGLRDLVTYALGYSAQTTGYFLLLTGRYPSSDPALAEPRPDLPAHPLRVVVTDELERSRVTVFFRLFLAIPHIVWIILWSIAAFFAAIAAWFCALVVGRVPMPLHRFLSAYVRYSVHLGAFVSVVGAKFPGFGGREGSYGIDLEIAPRARQHRLKTLFRFFLSWPALIVSSGLDTALLVVALLCWWYALVTGRVPEGLRNLGASCLRYAAQTRAYLLLVTDRYPYASPVLESRETVPEAHVAPLLGDTF
jgi:hypothetical protein